MEPSSRSTVSMPIAFNESMQSSSQHGVKRKASEKSQQEILFPLEDYQQTYRNIIAHHMQQIKQTINPQQNYTIYQCMQLGRKMLMDLEKCKMSTIQWYQSAEKALMEQITEQWGKDFDENEWKLRFQQMGRVEDIVQEFKMIEEKPDLKALYSNKMKKIFELIQELIMRKEVNISPQVVQSIEQVCESLIKEEEVKKFYFSFHNQQSGKIFKVPKAYLYPHAETSHYLKALIQGGFKESQEETVVLDHIEDFSFEIFIDWLKNPSHKHFDSLELEVFFKFIEDLHQFEICGLMKDLDNSLSEKISSQNICIILNVLWDNLHSHPTFEFFKKNTNLTAVKILWNHFGLDFGLDCRMSSNNLFDVKSLTLAPKFLDTIRDRKKQNMGENEKIEYEELHFLREKKLELKLDFASLSQAAKKKITNLFPSVESLTINVKCVKSPIVWNFLKEFKELKNINIYFSKQDIKNALQNVRENLIKVIVPKGNFPCPYTIQFKDIKLDQLHVVENSPPNSDSKISLEDYMWCVTYEKPTTLHLNKSNLQKLCNYKNNAPFLNYLSRLVFLQVSFDIIRDHSLKDWIEKNFIMAHHAKELRVVITSQSPEELNNLANDLRQLSLSYPQHIFSCGPPFPENCKVYFSKGQCYVAGFPSDIAKSKPESLFIFEQIEKLNQNIESVNQKCKYNLIIKDQLLRYLTNIQQNQSIECLKSDAIERLKREALMNNWMKNANDLIPNIQEFRYFIGEHLVEALEIENLKELKQLQVIELINEMNSLKKFLEKCQSLKICHFFSDKEYVLSVKKDSSQKRHQVPKKVELFLDEEQQLMQAFPSYHPLIAYQPDHILLTEEEVIIDMDDRYLRESIEDQHLLMLKPRKSTLYPIALDLSHFSQVTDEGLKSFLESYPFLSKINLQGCTSLTQKTIHFLLNKYNLAL